MSERAGTPGTAARNGASLPARGGSSLLGRFAAQFSEVAVPFEVVLPDGAVQRFGRGQPTFTVRLNNKRGQAGNC